MRRGVLPQIANKEFVDGESSWTDEVESLTAARAAAMSGNEPSDAVRVGLQIQPHGREVI